MNSINSVVISGRLGRDAEVRTFGDNGQVATLAVAVKGSRKSGGEWTETTAWVRVSIFGKPAEWAAEHGVKGAYVVVQGSLKQNEWDDKETGKKRTQLEVVAYTVEWPGGKRRQPGGKPKQASQHKPVAQQQTMGAEDLSDDF